MSEASKQADDVIAQFPSRRATWVVGPAWSAPYPTTWVTMYP